MEHTEKTEFFALLKNIGLWYGKNIPEDTLNIYWQLFLPFELHEVKRALHAHLQNPERGIFYPTPANIMKHLSKRSL
jgi:hypothetical protein